MAAEDKAGRCMPAERPAALGAQRQRPLTAPPSTRPQARAQLSLREQDGRSNGSRGALAGRGGPGRLRVLPCVLLGAWEPR